MEDMTNQELADCLRDGGGCQHEALARLLEADAKNHDLVAGQESKWRDALVAIVLAKEYLNSDNCEDPSYALSRLNDAIAKARVLLSESEMTLPDSAPVTEVWLKSVLRDEVVG